MTELTARQVRALILLLVLVPLVPTTLLFRLMINTVRVEQAAAREQMRDHALRTARTALKPPLPSAALSMRERAARLLDFYDRTFDKDVAVRIVDAGGRPIAGAAASPEEPIAEITLDAEAGGWRVQVFPNPGDAPQASFADQISGYLWPAALALLADLCIAGLAGYGLNRQLHLQEIKNSTLDMMAHELKTPLASIRVLLDTLLARETPPPAQLREYLELISGENARLARITENFLTLARLERGTYLVSRTPVAPGDLIQIALEAIRWRTENAAAQLAVEIAPDLPEVAADQDAMTIALANLIDNALKYTGDSKQITIKASSRKPHVLIEVTDNGPGIAPSEQVRIFERFHQADRNLSRRHEGCGLGLAIVKSIVEAHGGSIRVASREGAGSTFTIELPALRPSPAPALA
jgi:signal transduction histidine kinase